MNRITLTLKAIDGWRQRRTFRDLAPAQRFARKHLGPDADLSAGYAVSTDGVTILYADGVTLAQLFAPAVVTPTSPRTRKIADIRTLYPRLPRHVCNEFCGGDCLRNEHLGLVLDGIDRLEHLTDAEYNAEQASLQNAEN